MSKDFDLDKSRWYNTMMIGQNAKYTKDTAALIIKHARNLGNFEFDPVVLTEIAKAKDALTEALFAVTVAQEEYQQHTKQLVAAE